MMWMEFLLSSIDSEKTEEHYNTFKTDKFILMIVSSIGKKTSLSTVIPMDWKLAEEKE